MGLHVNIYKHDQWGDCTNGGASSRKIKGFCMIDMEGPFEPCEDYPAARVVYRENLDYYHIEPVEQYYRGEKVEGEVWAMFGGNYAKTSDSRFAYKGKKLRYPLGIHDRIER